MIGSITPLPGASSIEAAIVDNATGRLAGMTFTASDDAAAFANRLADIPGADAPVAHLAAIAYPGIEPAAETRASRETENADENGSNKIAITCPDNSDTESICAVFKRIYARYLAYAREHMCFAAYRP